MRAIVIGGGIGGAATALALTRAGWQVLVLEQARVLAPVGAGINLAANAQKVLDHLGVGPGLRRLGAESLEERYYDMFTGEHVALRRRLGPEAEAVYGAPYYSVHRADLLDALVRPLPPGTVRVGSRVTGVRNEGDGVVVELATGERLAADCCIAADGLKSRTRAQLVGEHPTRSTGRKGWRATIPRASLPPHLPLAEGLVLWLGDRRSVSSYPVRPDLVYFGAWVPAEQVHEDDWETPGGLAELRASFRDASPDIHACFDAIESSALSLFMTSVEYRLPIDRWADGRIVLAGDAAHPVIPAVGQGAAMALEDAVTIAACLAEATPATVPDALAEYAERRKPRTRHVLSEALGLQTSTRVPDPDARRHRDGTFRAMARLDPFACSVFGWITGFDAVAEASRPLEQVLAVKANPLVRPAARLAWDATAARLGPEDREAQGHSERQCWDESAPPAIGPAPATREIAGVRALVVGDGPTAVLYVHDGGFGFGSPEADLAAICRIAGRLGATVYAPAPGLSPETPYPIPVDRVASVHCAIAAERGPAPVVIGAGAGASIALAALLRVREAGGPLPPVLGLCSPFLDLALTADSIGRNDGIEPLRIRDRLVRMVAGYLQDADPAGPLVDPLGAVGEGADLVGLPPLVIAAAAGEALVDDATRLADRARSAGVPVRLQVVEDSVGAFLHWDLPETGAFLDALRAAMPRN